jgi:hypothetical protein
MRNRKGLAYANPFRKDNENKFLRQNVGRQGLGWCAEARPTIIQSFLVLFFKKELLGFLSFQCLSVITLGVLMILHPASSRGTWSCVRSELRGR